MRTYRTILLQTALAGALVFSLSGCYTQLATVEEETSYRDNDTTYQDDRRSIDDDSYLRQRTSLGFHFYYPTPFGYGGYDPWYDGFYYDRPWYYSGYIGYPFLYYPQYPYPYYSLYGWNRPYMYYPYGYSGYSGYYADRGSWNATRNSGARRTGSARGEYDNNGRGSSSVGAGSLSSPSGPYIMPRGGSNRSSLGTGVNSGGIPQRSGRSGSGKAGVNSTPSRGNSGGRSHQMSIPSRVNTPTSRQPASGGERQRGEGNSGTRSGGYSRSNSSGSDGTSRSTYVPSHSPSPSPAPSYSPPASSGGSSSGGGSRSSGSSRTGR
jgi:hypothetical protein